MGVPAEPGREFDEMVDEIMTEVKRRRESGSGLNLPADGMELRRRVESTVKERLEQGERNISELKDQIRDFKQ